MPARLDSGGWGGAWWPGRGRREASPWRRSWPGWPGLKEDGEEEEEEQEPMEQYIRVLWLRPARAYWREKGGGGTGAADGGSRVAGEAHDQRPGWQPAMPPANRRRSRGAQGLARGPYRGRAPLSGVRLAARTAAAGAMSKFSGTTCLQEGEEAWWAPSLHTDAQHCTHKPRETAKEGFREKD